MQPVDDGGDLQRQLAAAAAEDALALHAVAVVDAVADRVDVAAQPVGGGQRLAVEARPDPIDAVVGERLRFGELAGEDRPRLAGAAAGEGEREADGEQDERSGEEIRAVRTRRRRAELVVAAVMGVIILACPVEAQLLPGPWTVRGHAIPPLTRRMYRGPVG